MKKTIVLISTYNADCGIATYSRDLVLSLKKENVNVFVIAEAKHRDLIPKSEILEEIPVYRVWKRDAAYESQFGLSSIVRLLKNCKVLPDIVHIQHEFGIFPDNAGFWRLIDELSTMKIAVAITLHTVMPPPANIGFFRLFNNNVKIISHTNAARAILNNYYPFATYCIPHGVPQILLAPESTEYVNFMCLGFISPSKGHGDIIKAFAETWEHSGGCKLHIVGLCRDLGYLDKLNSQITSLALQDHILIDEGFKPAKEIETYLNTAQVIVLGGGRTSPFSASGQLAQAIGAGLPVIAKNIPIYRSQPSPSVLYYDDSKECALFMKACLNKDTRKELSNHAGFITFDEAAKKHLEVYFGVC